MLEITLPIYWKQSGKKTVLLSLNTYHNWHPFTYAKYKKEYHELVLNQIPKGLKISSPFRVGGNLYYKNAGSDPSNVYPMLEKVLLDALQEGGVISQDSMKHHCSSKWLVVGRDNENPRIRFIVESLNNE